MFILLSTTPFWAGVVICAFGCILSVITVDTAWSDAKKGRRGKMIGLAVAFALACIFFIIKTQQTSH